MKNFFILLGVGLFSILGYHFWEKGQTVPLPVVVPPPVVVVTPVPTPAPTPKIPEPHLTPEGTFALLDYVSVRTKTGVVGFEPGCMLRFVNADRTKGTLTVTDGTYQIAVTPDQLTNDLDLASIAKRRDQASQNALRAAIVQQKDEDVRIRLAADVDRAKSIARMPSGSAIGTSSVLSQGSSAASSYDAAYNESLRHRYYRSPTYYLYH